MKLVLFCLFVSVLCTQANGELSAVESLIRSYVIQNGGEWETEDSATLVSLNGDKFGDSSIELLQYVENIQWLNLDGIDCSKTALRWIHSQRSLERLYISDCGELSLGLHLVGPHVSETLKHLKILDSDISVEVMQAISGFKHLETLSLHQDALDPKSVEVVRKLSQLQVLNIITQKPFPLDSIRQLKGRLPNCEIRIVARRSDGSVGIIR